MFRGLKPSKQGSKMEATTKNRTRQKVETGKNRARKMKNFKSCFDPLERRGIPDLVWVATGDGVQLVLKR